MYSFVGNEIIVNFISCVNLFSITNMESTEKIFMKVTKFSGFDTVYQDIIAMVPMP